jgi:DNA-directed RNA polymerase subunit RPC12/RpoP
MEHTSQLTLRCPHCRSRRVRLSRFRFWELAVGLLLVRPYRCCKCSARFWRLRSWPSWPWRRPTPDLTLDDLRRTPFNARITPVPDR